MKAVATLVVLAVAAFAAAGCSDDEVKPEQFEYPLAVGTKWHYSHTWYQVGADSSVHILVEGTLTVSIAEVDSLTQVGRVFRFDMTYDNGSHIFKGYDYYQDRTDGFYRVGYCGDLAMGAPKLTRDATHSSSFRLPFLGSLAPLDQPCEGPWTIEPEGRLVLPYPIQQGESWTFFGPSPFQIDKQVVAWLQVAVPAGSWPAYQLRWTYPDAPSTETNDYIAIVGLVKREFIYRHVEVITPEHPYGSGEFVDQFDLIVLDSLDIHPGRQ